MPPRCTELCSSRSLMVNVESQATLPDSLSSLPSLILLQSLWWQIKQILGIDLPTISSTSPHKQRLLCSAETQATGIQGTRLRKDGDQVIQSFCLGVGHIVQRQGLCTERWGQTITFLCTCLNPKWVWGEVSSTIHTFSGAWPISREMEGHFHPSFPTIHSVPAFGVFIPGGLEEDLHFSSVELGVHSGDPEDAPC